MIPDTDQSNTPATKTGLKSDAKPDRKDDLKTLPLAEVERKLGSSPNGLTQAEAQKRLTQYGANELEEKKTNPILSSSRIFGVPSRG
jgi:H+-transporting ATPase